MNKKAFTLIELLGVIVILTILALITIPIIDSSLNKGKENLDAAQKQQLIKALKDYYSENVKELSNVSGEACKTINELKEAGALPADIRNPKTDASYEDSTQVCVNKVCNGANCNSESIYDQSNYSYEYYIKTNDEKEQAHE